MITRYFTAIPVLFSLFLLLRPVNGQITGKSASGLEKRAMKRSGCITRYFEKWKYLGEVQVDSIEVSKPEQILTVYLSPDATHIPVRTDWLDHLEREVRLEFGRKWRDYTFRYIARGRPLEDYVPNLYREGIIPVDTMRLSPRYRGKVLVTRLDQPDFPDGLTGRHIALWPSHGCFFDQQLDRWQWQRARLWETVEDIFTWSFTSDYLVPMLENAGAAVLLPRERDPQAREVIVDNDRGTGQSQLVITNGIYTWERINDKGFMPLDTLFTGQNPFDMGTSLMVHSAPGDTSRLTYIPDIPESGEYAVYVSWSRTDQCLDEVHYDVLYSGGRARFRVNQCMSAGTWVYLGTFHFLHGINSEIGSVILHGGDRDGILTADAVKFGGGMGNVARKPGLVLESQQKSIDNRVPRGGMESQDDPDMFKFKLSNKPRWMEGSRYYLQFAGMPDSLVYNLNNGRNDYNDDYMSRGEWVNYMIGPSKPQYDKKYDNGLGVPVDLALAFHTDAGVTPDDSIIGTLGIYSSVRNNGIFPNGQSKLASRDLADIIQSQLVEDIRKQANPNWTRRALWDREYSEAWRPMVPVVLLELLSHQNLADMKYGMDPRFKFLVARAIYKGMLRYLSIQDDRKVVIQPLPPDHMAIEALDDLSVRISWKYVPDPLESTAIPNGYKVYMKTEDRGFDSGQSTRDTFMIVTLPEWGKIYSFRVTAVNEGGESMPGETLSVSLLSRDQKPVLIVNAFDRICGPAVFDQGDMAGFAWWEDEGVPDKRNLSNSGRQYDFNRNSDWLHDDSQGWGASYADLETWPVAGNSFSFPFVHGDAFRKAGYSFVSVSDEVFESPGFDSGKYPAIDLIFGEERGTEALGSSRTIDFRVFTPAIMETIKRYTQAGGNVLISGAYIASDMVENKDSVSIQFASEVLHFTWRTNHAAAMGSVYSTDKAGASFPALLQFNTDDHSLLYRVEAPDAIEPAGEDAYHIYRYSSGNRSAGIAYKGSYRAVALGFPIETLLTTEQRTDLISAVMAFFNND